MYQAKDKAHYISRWESYAEQLDGLALPLSFAGKPGSNYYERLNAVQAEIKNLIQIAARNEFPNEE